MEGGGEGEPMRRAANGDKLNLALLDEVRLEPVVLVGGATGSSVTDPRNDWLSMRMVEGSNPRGSLRARRLRLTIFKIIIQRSAPKKTTRNKDDEPT